MSEEYNPTINIVEFANLPQMPFHKSCITIGNFDGVHLGHQAIIQQIVHRGKSKGRSIIVITFFPNPIDFFSHSKNHFYLTSPVEKEEILLGLGVDKVITFRFDQDFANLSPEKFFSAIKEKLNLGTLVVGYDFAMGKNRQGTIPVLKSLGEKMDFTVEVLAPVEFDGKEISSTRIRQALESGDVRLARKLLGRPYQITGEVTHGADRGSRIGLPTANMTYWALKQLPAEGVYATHPILMSKTYEGITNVGYRPTFEHQDLLNIETHILDFDGNIYGKKLELEFIEKIRDERKFSGVEAFLAQIERDKATARRIFRHDET